MSTFRELVTNIQNHWIQFYAALNELHSSDLSQSLCDELVNNFPNVFRSFRSICDCMQYNVISLPQIALSFAKNLIKIHFYQ